MEMIAAHVGGPVQGFPCSLLPGTLSSRGPPPSLVFRTEDVWLRYNQFIETAEFSIRVYDAIKNSIPQQLDKLLPTVVMCDCVLSDSFLPLLLLSSSMIHFLNH